MTSPYAPTSHSNGYEFTQGSGYSLPEYAFVPPDALASGKEERLPIVIVGGGLAGLTLACSLANLGMPCVLLDEDNTVGVKGASSRGICYTQKSLEIFDRLGIYERIAQKGVRWSVGRTFAGEDEVYSFDLSKTGGFDLSRQPPFINIQQFYIEGFLVERILELGHADIRWKSRVTACQPSADGVRLTVETPAGSYRIRAAHVIDATGSRSPFRAWAEVSVTAKKGDDRWCIADVRFTTQPPTERHTWIEAPFNDDRAVWQHLMADDVWRIDYQMAPDADPAYVSREDVVRERLARQFGPDCAVEVVWVGPYAYRSECVDRMRVNGIYFIGDAAKVVSPFGARGGNTGIADADNLAWKLAAVVRGRAAPALLESFHDERHEAATTNVRVTNRTARFLRPADGVERLFRRATIGLARRYAFARPMVNTGRMAVANPYSQSGVCGAGGGRSVQNVALAWSDGSAGTFNDLLRWAGGDLLLLVFGPLDREDASMLRSLVDAAPVKAVQIVANASAATARECAVDESGALARACGLLPTDRAGGPRWTLVRPDSYLAAVSRRPGIDASLVDAVQRALGAAETTLVEAIAA